MTKKAAMPNHVTTFPLVAGIITSNRLAGGAASFILYPGMEFASRSKWWPGTGLRPTPHEGLDFCYYRDHAGRTRQVTVDLRVPLVVAGKIMAICEDYLGHTVFVEHGGDGNRRFCSVYAHIVPEHGLVAGMALACGTIVGTLADTTGHRHQMPAHLHFSLIHVDRDISPDGYDWDLINRSNRSELVDPYGRIDANKVIRLKDKP